MKKAEQPDAEGTLVHAAKAIGSAAGKLASIATVRRNKHPNLSLPMSRLPEEYKALGMSVGVHEAAEA